MWALLPFLYLGLYRHVIDDRLHASRVLGELGDESFLGI
jgi:hypothetical protein